MYRTHISTAPLNFGGLTVVVLDAAEGTCRRIVPGPHWSPGKALKRLPTDRDMRHPPLAFQ